MELAKTLSQLRPTEFWHVFWFGAAVGAAVTGALIAAFTLSLEWWQNRRRDRHDFGEVFDYEVYIKTLKGGGTDS